MATFSEALRRVYSDMIKRRARVRVSPAVEPKLAVPPIFLIGLYRSGTTLLRYVMDSHTRIACPPESAFLVHLHNMVDDPRSSSGLESLGYDRQHVIGRMRVFGSYFFEGYAASRGKPRWADKSPVYVEHLGFLAELFPACRMVMIHRHPLDQIHSATRAGRSRPSELAGFAIGTEDARVTAARYWRAKTDLILDFHQSDVGRGHALRYEDLCDDPAGTLQPVFEHIGEVWEPSVLEFYKYEHDRGFEDGRVGVTRGFSASRGNYLAWPSNVIDDCWDVVQSTATRLGYQLDRP